MEDIMEMFLEPEAGAILPVSVRKRGSCGEAWAEYQVWMHLVSGPYGLRRELRRKVKMGKDALN